jgi:DNA-binding response OmpR family regulator
MGRILVIEDDLTVQKALLHTFETAGYAVTLCDGTNGIEGTFRPSLPTAVVLDLCLPVRPGKEVCRGLKSKYPSLPVVILSAVTDVSDKVLLLELGADDYVTKPFSPRELLARVEAAVRRSARPAGKDIFNFGDAAVNFASMTVTRKGVMVQLTPQEFKLLKFLVDNQDRVVTRDQLLNEVWGYNSYPSTRTVDNHVLRLRHKLENDPTEPLHFRTVHSVGYKFVP